MRSSLKQRLKYINWRLEGTKETLCIAEFNEKLAKFKLTRHVANSKTIRQDFIHGDSYTYSERGYYRNLYCYENGKLMIYGNHMLDDKKNKNNTKFEQGNYKDYEGKKSKVVVSKLFYEDNKTTEKTAFGYCDREVMYRTIPKPVYYINSAYCNEILHNVSKADYSSNYPSNMTGIMPDWHTHIVRKGTVKPTEEYPFAYYIESGHIAEYNRFDTHNWLYHELGINLFNTNPIGKENPRIRFNQYVKPEDDITILCKPSKYTFDSVVDKLYKAKLEKKVINGVPAKIIMNAYIGMMHVSNLNSERFRLEHVAAIVIGRANQTMLDLYDKLKHYNITVLQMIVDGTIYKSPLEFGVKEKSLGALVQEITNQDFKMIGINQYMFRDKETGELLDCKHTAYKDEETDKSSFDAMNEWKKGELNER